MAVRLDADALLASVGQDLSELGREHLARGHVHDLEADDGGAGAMVGDPEQGLLGVWVGVVDGELTGECDCADGAGGRLCGHAVAVALGALEEGFPFASVASRAVDVDPEEQRFAEVVAFAIASAIALVEPANFSNSKTPEGPFQMMVLARPITWR
jgi:uncharacterized Zn finger protein